tara:strand:- start:331 stop:510 length:180 start_codon:yes stop_codon:yes gene_type:complete
MPSKLRSVLIIAPYDKEKKDYLRTRRVAHTLAPIVDVKSSRLGVQVTCALFNTIPVNML